MDRLEADEGDSLEGREPVEWSDVNSRLRRCLAALAALPQAKVARELGLSERRLLTPAEN